MIEHVDRLPANPGRVTLTPVVGQTNTYDLARADNPATAGTAINKALLDEFLAASGTTTGTNAALLLAQDGFALIDGATIRCKVHLDVGPGATLSVNGTAACAIKSASLENVLGLKAGAWITLIYNGTYWILQGPPSVAAGWILLQEYIEAGTYTFTAPDLYGGSDYEVGVFIGGGGGAGGASKRTGSTGYPCAAGGGAGHTRAIIINLIPNTNYTVVIGTGGAAVTTSTSAYANASGNNGNSSSFNGVSASGGGGGGSSTATIVGSGVSGADGGQGSNGVYGGDIGSSVAPCEGTISLLNSNNDHGRQGATAPLECFNPFTYELILSAGGSSARNSAQTVKTLADGLSGGAGAYSGENANLTANSATSPGSGGGAATIYNSSSTYSVTATSGSGADGFVKIYIRGAA